MHACIHLATYMHANLCTPGATCRPSSCPPVSPAGVVLVSSHPHLTLISESAVALSMYVGMVRVVSFSLHIGIGVQSQNRLTTAKTSLCTAT